MGIIYEMTMVVVPEYGVEKCIYENVPWDFFKDKAQFDRLNQDRDYISFFLDWHDEVMFSVWTGQRYHGTQEEY